MTATQATSMVRELFGTIPDASLRIRLWDGTEEVIGSEPAFTLVFRDPETFSALVKSGDTYQFAMAYVEDRVDIEGDFYAALKLKSVFQQREQPFLLALGMITELGFRARHSKIEDQKNVQAHYDVSNDFYKLFLDSRVMAYSCAYFHREDESLEDAQEHKVDLICRKLRLKAGERLLDIGCGWGGLLIHAAKNYGVIGHGVTLSKNQFELATARVKEAGLSDKITIELRDYRDLADASFDKIASVGMYEHVGIRHYPEYFGAAKRLLKDGGLFLNHGITVPKGGHLTGEARFIFTHIFPNAQLDTISHTQLVIEDLGLEVLNVESLRPHYAKTLREWERRLSANWDKALATAPKETCRAWRIYLAGCALGFEEGRISVHQTLMAKAPHGEWQVPLTPHDVYC